MAVSVFVCRSEYLSRVFPKFLKLLDIGYFPASESAGRGKSKIPATVAVTGILRLVVEVGFEPTKSLTTDLQSAPFGHSGTPPCFGEIQLGRFSP